MNKQNGNTEIRKAYQAGRFYPKDSNAIKNLIKHLFEEIDVQPNIAIRTGIVPHAGIIYSGLTASHFYSSIKKNNYKRIVIIGPSHYSPFNGICLSNVNKWETPLGEIENDIEFAEKLIDKNIFFNNDLHIEEHSIEVQLPFLQYIFGRKMKIVPIMIGEQNNENVMNITEKLIKNDDDETLFIASSDLYHGYNYEQALMTDKNTVKHILSDKRDMFMNYFKGTSPACGGGAIAVILGINEEKHLKTNLLHQITSSDITQDFDSYTVGYASFMGVPNVK